MIDTHKKPADTTPSAPWSEAALASHLEAARLLETIKDAAFAHISDNLGRDGFSELSVKNYIIDQYLQHGIESEGEPIVAVNANSRFPHYDALEGKDSPIKPGDLILVDIWARQLIPDGTFADITWMAFAGAKPSKKQQEIFTIVREARDLTVERVTRAWQNSEPLEGWQLDRVARDHIEQVGFGKFFIHTTGHALGPGPHVHAIGTNLNDMSRRDTRPVLPNTGFTVEPGIYIPEFGVRLELDVYMDPAKGPTVTTPAQTEIVLL